MMQFGVILPHLGSSQLSYIVTQQMNKVGGVIFEKFSIPPIQRVSTAVLPVYEIPKFEGVLIATDLDGVRYLINLASPARKLFYPWQMEWLKHGNNYVETVKVFTNPLIEVIARSKSYARQIQLMNREPSAIIEDLNLENFRRYCNEHEEIRRYVNTGDIIPGVRRERKKYNLHS